MLSFQLLAALLVLAAGIAGGTLAVRLLSGKAKLSKAALANAFAGGVFLGAAFLHMLPDAIGNFNVWLKDFDYPMFALTASAGFLIVLMLDKVIGPALGGAKDKGAIYPYILMLTLSVHSVITGTALGLETHLVSAGAILFAVLAHKSTAAMALSISFTKGDAPAIRSRNLLWLFYTTTPIGILLGTWIGANLQGEGEVHFEAIFDALAAGTFFYIAVMDILAEEFSGKGLRLPLYSMAVLGFTIMALVALWT